MIYFKFLNDPHSRWVKTTHQFLLANVNFKRSSLKINGVVYTEKSPELTKAFKDARLWSKLQE